MANALIEYQFIIRNATDTGDELEITSVRGGTNPYISGVPTGDGASIDPNTGKVTSGAYTLRIVDPITSGSSRLFTSKLDDSDGKPQLGQRKAFLNQRVDGGAWSSLIAGRVDRHALLENAIEWDVTITDWMKAEHETLVFAAQADDTIDDFLTRWPKRGCMYGGPVRGGFLTMPNVPGWQMRVRRITSVGNLRYRLEPVIVYGPDPNALNSGWIPGGKLSQFAGKINEAVRTLAQSPFEFTIAKFGGLDTVKKAQGPGMRWQGLVVLVGPDSAPVPFRPISSWEAGQRYGGSADTAFFDLLSTLKGQEGAFVYQDTQTELTEGQLVQVRCLTILPTELCPIYYVGHPIDLLALMWTEVGFPYNAASMAAVKAAIGPAEIAIRVTEPQNLGRFAEQLIYGPFGVGARTNDDAELEVFTTRIIVNTLPSTTITAADVDLNTVRAYENQPAEAIRRMTLEHQKFQVNSSQAVDGVTVSREIFDDTNGDTGAVGTGEVSYVVPGMIRFLATAITDLVGWVDGKAAELFYRWGRGPIRARMLLLRGGAGDSVQMGDEVLVDLPQMPKSNKRLGDDAMISSRAMQVLQLTPDLRGKWADLLDAGPNAQPLDTAPELSIAASTDYPRNIADLTIDNASDLNDDDLAVRVQIAITTGADPDDEDFTDFAFFKSGAVPTVAFQLPAVTADRTVFARARTEKNDGNSRPSDWTDPVSVALDALNAPTSLVSTPDVDDASRCALTWDSDEPDAHVEIFLKKSSQASDEAILVVVLPPGSTQYVLEDLEDDEEYDVSVNHLDQATGDRSDAATDTFTAGADVVALSAPTDPDAFAYIDPDPVFTARYRTPDARGVYGMGVVAATTADIPGDVEIAEAVETAVGSDTYGSYTTVGRVPAVAGDWTVWARTAPNDGLKRKLKARHIRGASLVSTYTEEVFVTPWTVDPLVHAPPSNALRFATTGMDTDYLYGDLKAISAAPKGAGSITLVDIEPTDTSLLIDPSPDLFNGVSSGTPTTDFATTGSVAVQLARPAAFTGDGSERFQALQDGIPPAECTVVVPEKDAIPANVSGVALVVDAYGPPSLLHVDKTITGDYVDFVVTITPDVGAPVDLAPGVTSFDATTLFGFNLRATPGIQTHTLEATVTARDNDGNPLASDSSGTQTYDADPDT